MNPESGLQVRIVEMGARRLAYVQAFGTVIGDPEREAHGKLHAWARAKGLLAGRAFHWFGANDPPPAREGDRYGYFSGLTVPESVGPEGEVLVREIRAGAWAVTRIRGLAAIGSAWLGLYRFAETSPLFRVAGHGLEEILCPIDDPDPSRRPEEMVLDLWLPVAPR